MAVVLIKDVPFKFTIPTMKKILTKVVRGNFEILDVITIPKKPGQNAGGKIFSIKLDPNLSADRVRESINTHTTFTAYQKRLRPRAKYKLNLHPSIACNDNNKNTFRKPVSVSKLLTWTLDEILTEMQSKFTGLYNLAKKTNFELMHEISRVVLRRLKQLADDNDAILVSGFRFSSAYRKAHPHSGDFPLIVSTLHKLQDAAGVPRAHIVEADLCKNSTQPLVFDDVPMDKFQVMFAKYTERIIQKVEEHLASLEVDVMSDNAEQDAARKEVREQLKKLNPYMSKIVKDVILTHFIPRSTETYYKVRIYGVPFLPRGDKLMTLISQYGATTVLKSERMYNLLKICVPLTQYQALFSHDGEMIGNNKILIRSSHVPLYHAPGTLVREMKVQLGIVPDDSEEEKVKEDIKQEVDMDMDTAEVAQ